MSENNKFDLIFPGKWQKSKIDGAIKKFKQIQNLWDFVRKSRGRRYFLQK